MKDAVGFDLYLKHNNLSHTCSVLQSETGQPKDIYDRNKLSKEINTTNKIEINGLFGYLAYLKEADTNDHDYSETKYKDIKWLSADESISIAQDIKETNDCYLLKDLAVNGNDFLELGIEPGPVVKDILNALLRRVIAGELENNREVLLAEIKDIKQKLGI